MCIRDSMYFNYKGVWTGGHDVVGALSPDTAFYFAEGTCRPGFDPYICIQNTDSAEAPVKITYMKGDGTTDSQTLTVAKHSRSTVVVKDKLGEGDDAAHDFSAKVESVNGVPIIAERPMYFNYKGVWTGGHDVVGAVSYTHLRAHETRHDLVCRLLLEKKKRLLVNRDTC